MSARRPGQIGRFVRDWLQPHWRLFAAGALFAALTSLAVASYGLLVKAGVDWLSVQGTEGSQSSPVALLPGLKVEPQAMMWLLPAMIVLAAIVRSLSLYAQTMFNNAAVQRGLVALQGALFGRLLAGDYARLTEAASGEYVSRFVNDMNLVRETALRLAANLIKGVLTVVACIATMLVLDWALALLILLVYPIAFMPVIRIGQRLRKLSLAAQVQAGEMTAALTEGIQGARTTKAFNLEARQQQRMNAGFQARAQHYLRILRGRAAVDPLLEVVGGFALAGVLAFTGWRVANGQATVGDLGGFIAAIAAASPEVRALGTLNAVANEGAAALERVHAILDAPDSVTDAQGAADIGHARGAVAFEDVTFGYGPDATVLRGARLAAEPGEMIAVVGASGAGKSTLFNLLLRFYDPQSGAVRLDGQDLRALTRDSLRKNLALVAQDAFLFEGTVRENIALGRENAGEAEIRAAAADAACDFIDSLPGGLDAKVGEGGRNLSGGQRQRVALARALLSRAPVLLLDEATSALDSESEAQIQGVLARLAGKRTIMVIAHRLATVRRASRIYVLDQGAVVESGSHEALIAASGTYARLVARQLM